MVQKKLCEIGATEFGSFRWKFDRFRFSCTTFSHTRVYFFLFISPCPPCHGLRTRKSWEARTLPEPHVSVSDTDTWSTPLDKCWTRLGSVLIFFFFLIFSRSDMYRTWPGGHGGGEIAYIWRNGVFLQKEEMLFKTLGFVQYVVNRTHPLRRPLCVWPCWSSSLRPLSVWPAGRIRPHQISAAITLLSSATPHSSSAMPIALSLSPSLPLSTVGRGITLFLLYFW